MFLGVFLVILLRNITNKINNRNQINSNYATQKQPLSNQSKKEAVFLCHNSILFVIKNPYPLKWNFLFDFIIHVFVVSQKLIQNLDA